MEKGEMWGGGELQGYIGKDDKMQRGIGREMKYAGRRRAMK